MYLEYNPHIINNKEIRKISTCITNVTCITGIRYEFKSDAKNIMQMLATNITIQVTRSSYNISLFVYHSKYILPSD